MGKQYENEIDDSMRVYEHIEKKRTNITSNINYDLLPKSPLICYLRIVWKKRNDLRVSVKSCLFTCQINLI